MFAADARKHTPGKNAEKENFSMRILVAMTTQPLPVSWRKR